ncbi:MAG TPA: sensor histidine kinase, partial [Anaerolineae bacterium]|nr:sensor histidine kinase [Anaerolineae bacterium]
RELHDQAGQALSSLVVGLGLMERNVGRPEALVAGIAELRAVADCVMDDLHRLAMDLRPASLDHLGLTAALRQHMESVSQKHGLAIRFETLGIDERLPADVETALYRMAQEALTNVVRHAKASRVSVLVEQRGGSLHMIVEDDGAGFDPAAACNNGRLGLFGIRERAELLGGRLFVESAPGAGTALVLEVPYGGTHSPRG